MINKTILFGFLVADPEVRYTKTGKCICNFRIAHRENGKEDKDPLFISVDVWEKQGEICGKNLKKGSNVIVEGRLCADTYEKDGKQTTKIFIVADRVNFVPRFESKNGGERGTSQEKDAARPPAKKSPPKTENTNAPAENGDDDDIPF